MNSNLLFKREIYDEIKHNFDKSEEFYIVKRFNNNPKGKIIWNEEQKEHIYDLHYNAKIAVPYIAHKFNINHTTIRALFKKENKEIKNYTTYKEVYRINHNYFNKIDNPNKAYWLGMLYADGSMIERQYSIKLYLQGFDMMHVHQFQIALETNYPFEFYINNRKGSYGNDDTQMCGLKVRSEQMFKDLCGLGCVPRKSEILKFPTREELPFEFVKDFIRGYTDGDGSLSFTAPVNKRHYSIEWCGTESMLQGILKYFREIGIETKANVRPIKRHRFLHKLSFNGNNLAPKVINHLYDDCDTALFRKKNIYYEMNDYLNKI